MEYIKHILAESQFEFELIYHKQSIYSAQEGANYFGIEIGQTAPTLILKTDKGYFALIISGERGQVDLEEIAKILACNKVELAPKSEVKQIIGFTVGSIPMVGLSLPCLVDQRLYQYNFVYGGTGDRNYTLKIVPQALTELNRVVASL